ncbi:MAG TPA: fibro-slime domain-containing protein [Candidatus Limiplasma pullistercoris]|nr:fibro-slime domain-containing protein [Candidatus Limiplasma pullistercoris]
MLKNRICACLLVALLLAAMLPVSVAAAGALPSGTPAYEQNTFVGVSPLGTTINLFDYWLTGQTDPDNEDRSPGFENQGINKGHALLFGKGMDHKQYGHGLWNTWTGSEDPSPRKGIVADELGYDGYPVLNQGVPGRDYMPDREGGESLAYLFDPDRTHDGKAVYKDVQGLLSINEDDYYAYDSTKNYAVYYQTSSHGDSNNFRLYDLPGVLAGGSSPDGQFFPFNAVQTESHGYFEGTEYYNSSLYSNDAHINHYFGLHMSTRFVQQYGGYTTKEQKKAVTYTFSGDDDVWVFIDGTLVADLGGIHDKASLSINFATGVITINGKSQEQTLGDLLNPGSKTLPDDTYHTLDFFYLERGNVDSNMSLKYNLVYVPESNIYKIDQDGNPLRDRDFELYEAVLQEDGSYDAGKVLAKGTTDADGRIILLDENNDLLTIQELFDELNPEGLTNETTALILRETDSPDDGYRSSGDLELYFYQPASQTGSPPFLLSKNHWQTGAHAVARLTATTDEEIKYGDGLSTTFKPEENLMFAVVFKKVGEKWLPISGSSATGWTVVAESDLWNGIKKANTYPFVLSSSGSYTALIDELPGDVKKYEEAVGVEEEGRYRIVYYFSNQNNLEAIDKSNTFEITSPMNRVAAVNLYVPNISNDLTVQKLDQNGNLITGGSATFALLPADQGGKYNPPPQTTVNGVATFTAIPNGTYYLVETAAPKGYTANATQVKVIVNDTGVYANAGTAEDGISVERGVGRLVNSMAQFASKNTVDTTLNQIVAKFYTTQTEPNEDFPWRKIIEGSTDNDPAFSPVEGVVYHPAYSVTGTSSENPQWYLYGTVPGSTTPVGMHLTHSADHSGDRCNGLYQTTVKLAASGGPGITAQETDTGWSALLVEQCMFHTRDNDTPHTNLTGKNLTDLTALFTGDVTVKVKNDPIVGKLAVQKTVAGNAGETGREWEFTIELKNANGTALSGDFHYEGESIVTDVTPPTGGKLTFDSDGKATIRLKHGQKITIKGIPANVIYTVTEDKADGYETTPDGGTTSGKIEANKTAMAAFTNTKSVYQRLTVEKTVEGADGDKEKAWEFTIELKNADGMALNGNFPYKGGSIVTGVTPPTGGTLTFGNDGKATIRLKHGQKIIIEDIPVNATYTVTETEAGKDGYVTTPNVPISGKIEAGKDATASFTNSKTILRGGLTVTKTVAGNAGDKDRKWNFTVTLSDTGISGTYGGMSFKDGVATFTLKHGEQKTATGLPAGIDYFVSEAEASQYGYTTRATDASGRIPAEGTATAAFTNMKSIPRGNLSVSKTVSGSNPPSKTAFGFTVILSDRTVDGRFGEMTFRSGVAEFTLRHGETVTASGLPAGVGYLVEEDADEAYTTSSQGAEGTVPQDDTALARFVNSRIVLPPKTGDDSHTELWFMLMAFSLCCAAFLIGHQKRGGRTGR